MRRTLAEIAGRSYWQEWEAVRCPTLAVRASNGVIRPEDAREMAARLPAARIVEVAGAEHDVHLDRPVEWRAAVEEFLSEQR